MSIKHYFYVSIETMVRVILAQIPASRGEQGALKIHKTKLFSALNLLKVRVKEAQTMVPD
jgi:hypothetical protein